MDVFWVPKIYNVELYANSNTFENSKPELLKTTIILMREK